MAGTYFARVLLITTATAFLAGCQGGGSPFAKADKPATAAVDGAADGAIDSAALPEPDKKTKPAKAATKSVKLVDRDIEAPEVFSVTDQALWDGRPSLGGVWVASPDAVDPERVILRNPANGKFVIGALFRRERDNPGPALQISSDAATALGLLAGQPGKLSVTALRREEAPVAAPDASKPLLDVAETVETEGLAAEAVATKALDPIAGAEAAVATAEAAAGAAPQAAAEAKPKAKGFGLFKKKAPKPKADQTAAVVNTGPKAPVVSSALPAAEAPAAPKAATAAPASGGGGGLIQIGIFSVEANAKRAADTLGKAGLSASIREEKLQGKPFWSVTASGGADALSKAKAAGFTDAYILKRG